VVVEAQGDARTKDGRDYRNTYCFVLKLANGKITESREYMDTQLVKATFGWPEALKNRPPGTARNVGAPAH
jgi:ketosteroid isomerase-like protein